MSDDDLLIAKELDKDYSDSGSNSDSSVGIKDFGQDDSEISEDELKHSSGDDDDDADDKLLEAIQNKLSAKKQKNDSFSEVIFVDEFASDTNDDTNNNIDDINMNDNKLKILKDKRAIKRNGKYYKKPPRFTFSNAKLEEKIVENVNNIVNISVVGPFRSGKTTLVSNMLVKKHRKHFQRQKYDYLNLKKYMDNSLITKYRKTTTRLNMGRFLHDNSEVVNVIDTPGHSDFWNETQLAMEMSDFVYIVIDSVEGVTDSVVKLYEIAKFQMGLKVAFIINKIDRLILELRLDEIHFFLKLQEIVNDINKLDDNEYYSPEEGNILFSSSKFHFLFSLEQFVSIIYKSYGENEKLLSYMVARLWGNVVFENSKFFTCLNWKKLKKEPSFVTFVARPLFQLFKQGLVLKTQDLKKWIMENFGCLLKSSAEDEEYTAQLIKVFECVFENENTDLKNSLPNHCFVKHATAGSSSVSKIHNKFVLNTENVPSVSKLIRIFKVIDYKHKLWSLCRVYKGHIAVGDTLYLDNNKTVTISEMAVMGGRFALNITKAYENQIVLIRGSDYDSLDSICGAGNLTAEPQNDLNKKVEFKSTLFVNEPILKVFLQTKQMKHLTLLNKGLKLISKLYPDIKLSVDTSREYTLYGCGELQLDTILFELRYFYICYFDRDITDFIEIKTTGNIVTAFKESCSTESFASIPVTSKNYSLGIVASKISDSLSAAICKGEFSPENLFKEKKLVDLSSALRNEFGWESEMSRNLMAVSGTNFFVNDILPDDLDNEMFEDVKPYLVKAFERVISEGPLLEEKVQNVVFKLMTLDKLDENAATPLEVLPLTVKASQIALLAAKPILLEPYYSFSIITKKEYERNACIALRKRRGSKLFYIKEIPGSSLIELTGIIPCIDSNGLCVDMQLVTHGSSISQFFTIHKRWYKVPGDVLDENVKLSKTEPAEGEALSREFLMKTRKRKGLENQDTDSLNDTGPSLRDYIDPELFLQLKELKLV